MQISSIGPSFGGKRENVDAFICMDDKAVRDLSSAMTALNYNHEKSRKVTKALFYSAPIAAGLATAVLSKGGNTKIFSHEMTGLGASVSRGLKVAAAWTAGLAAIDGLGFIKNKAAENSPSVRRFDRNHPALSLLGMLGGAFGALVLVNKGAIKLGKIKAPEALQTFAKKSNKFLNNNKNIKEAKAFILKNTDKLPVALKDIGKTLLSWSPTMLLFGGLFHSIGSVAKENREFNKNYICLKQHQSELAKTRIKEMEVLNDLMMQDPKNREQIAMLNS